MVKINRYARNFNTLSREEHEQLVKSKVCVIGCGGLGGHIIEMLGRLGVGNITAVDGDVFEESNLNRQILATENTLGQSKAKVAKERMKTVNSEINVEAIVEYVDESNVQKILAGHQVIIDALDNIPSRLVLQDACQELKLPLVHGAIAGWYGQVTTIFPGEATLSKIYGKDIAKGAEKELGNPSFTPALIASIEVSEVVKILIDRGDLLRNKLLFVNVLEQEYNVINL